MARKTAPRARPQPRQIFGITPAGTPDIRSLLETFMGIGDASPDGVFAYFRIVAWLYHMGDGGTPDCQTTVIAVYGAPELAGADGPLGAYLTFGPCPPNPRVAAFRRATMPRTGCSISIIASTSSSRFARSWAGWAVRPRSISITTSSAPRNGPSSSTSRSSNRRGRTPVRRRARAR